jgi:hypothetical protein
MRFVPTVLDREPEVNLNPCQGSTGPKVVFVIGGPVQQNHDPAMVPRILRAPDVIVNDSENPSYAPAELMLRPHDPFATNVPRYGPAAFPLALNVALNTSDPVRRPIITVTLLAVKTSPRSGGLNTSGNTALGAPASAIFALTATGVGAKRAPLLLPPQDTSSS